MHSCCFERDKKKGLPSPTTLKDIWMRRSECDKMRATQGVRSRHQKMEEPRSTGSAPCSPPYMSRADLSHIQKIHSLQHSTFNSRLDQLRKQSVDKRDHVDSAPRLQHYKSFPEAKRQKMKKNIPTLEEEKKGYMQTANMCLTVEERRERQVICFTSYLSSHDIHLKTQ